MRHFVPAPDAVVVQLGDDTMVERSTFEPVTGRMRVERTVHRDGAVRHASYFIRLPTPPEWVVWLEDAGFRDVRFQGRRGRAARAGQLGDGGGGHGIGGRAAVEARPPPAAEEDGPAAGTSRTGPGGGPPEAGSGRRPRVPV